ncbi:G/U mismatch-specific uracil-DNA glycosylase [Kitasatospora cineracea]|uniref:G/U mismatch-specific uracil-DNA glycosylase n=1 Tax=Kitasatospora cineracea TaxID=88074 RepID=A0A8G1XDW3_9ACTN|nr:G/U mismatch-specific DNA glycosylase [Kitasatospora cineracea]ROR46895.1 G/U mismatch-specific uracil-DNA glycosylase [Kitasatospora cineracea]
MHAPETPGRGTRFTRVELEAARSATLPDLIADDLTLLLCGINPGLGSAAAGLHFSNPGNRLWPALHRAGFTPRRFSPTDENELLALGIGITTLVPRATARAAELERRELVDGGRRLRARVRRRRPAWLAPLGITAYRVAFDTPGASVGLQARTLGSTRIWVLPNPSGLNAHYPPARLAEEFARLREAIGLPDRAAEGPAPGAGPGPVPRSTPS